MMSAYELAADLCFPSREHSREYQTALTCLVECYRSRTTATAIPFIFDVPPSEALFAPAAVMPATLHPIESSRVCGSESSD